MRYQRLQVCGDLDSANALLAGGWQLVAITTGWPPQRHPDNHSVQLGVAVESWYHFGLPAEDNPAVNNPGPAIVEFLDRMDPDVLYQQAAELPGDNFVGNVLEVLKGCVRG